MAKAVSDDRGKSHDDLAPLLAAMFKEFQEAARKKPDAVLNAQKVRIVNRLLTDVLAILDGEPSRTYLELLKEDDLPQNSDVTLMLGQVVAAMDAFKERYYTFGSGWGRLRMAQRKSPPI